MPSPAARRAPAAVQAAVSAERVPERRPTRRETTMTSLESPTQYLFFTGKGGVGKTSLACAAAVELADAGKRVLLVSTDPASNLDEMLGVALSDVPTPVVGAERLFAMNIDPQAAAEAYRMRALGPLRSAMTEAEIAAVREQLSGACTTEIASF